LSEQQELAPRPDEKEKLLPIGSSEIKKEEQGLMALVNQGS
jgi:hypothetical protein